MNNGQRFFRAIAAGNVDEARRLLEEDPSLVNARNEEGHSPVTVATYHRKEQIVHLLLAVDPPLDLFEAAAVGKTERVRELLDADPDSIGVRSGDGFTALHLACFFNHPESAKLLLERGAEVNAVAKNPTRVQPLHSAAASRNAETVALLLERGADVDAEQQGGWTTLHAAAQHNDLGMARVLCAHGADVGRVTDDGKRPIDLLDAPGSEELHKLLAAG